MKIRSEAGFSVIEGLLALIAVTLIVFVGFYVYNSSNTTNKTLDTATKKTKTETKSNAPAKYLSLKELGIKVPLNDKLRDLEYVMYPTSDDGAGLTTREFKQAVEECRSTDQASGSTPVIGTVEKVSGQYDSASPPQNFFAEFAKQFPNFYITYGTPDGGPAALCTGSDQTKTDKVVNMFKELSPVLKTAVENSQQI